MPVNNSNADLIATIGADLTGLKAGLAEGGKSIQDFSNQTSQIAKDGVKSFDTLGGSTLSYSMRLQQMRSGLSATRDTMLAFAVGGQRADMMLMAAGHHFTSLYNETGSLKGAFSALGTSLIGPGGIILGITVLYEAYEHLSKSTKDAKDDTMNFKSSSDVLKGVFADTNGEYSKAIESVNKLRIDVDLAKQGLVSKSAVVKEYNDTIGKAAGKVKDLDDVEQGLTKHADAYVKMTLYKAAANLALQGSAQKALEAEQERVKKASEYQNFADRSNLFGITSAQDAKNANDQILANEKSRQAGKIKIAQDASNVQLGIARDFETKAAQIAKENGLTIFDDKDKKAEKAKSLLQDYEDQLKKLQDQEERFIAAGGIANQFEPTKVERNIDIIKGKIDELKSKLAGIDATVSIKGTNVLPGAGEILNNSNLNQTPKIVSSGEAGMQKALTDLKERNDLIGKSAAEQRDYNKEITIGDKATLAFGNGLMSAFQGALAGTQNFVSAMGNFIAQLIEKLIAAALAAAVLATLLSFTGLGNMMGLASSASSFSGLFSSLSGLGTATSKIPGHADGGITTRPHLAMVGEGKEQEAIMPLSKLNQFVANTGGGQIQIQPFQIGSQLWFKQTNRTNKTMNRLT